MKPDPLITVMIGAIALAVTVVWGWFIYTTVSMVVRGLS